MKTLRYLPVSFAAAVTVAQQAYAQVDKPDLSPPTKGTDFGTIIVSVINGALLFAAAVAVLFLVFGGFRYVTSTGNEQQVAAAKNTILYAVLGLIIIFVAFVLVQLVQNLLGVKPGFLV